MVLMYCLQSVTDTQHYYIDNLHSESLIEFLRGLVLMLIGQSSEVMLLR